MPLILFISQLAFQNGQVFSPQFAQIVSAGEDYWNILKQMLFWTHVLLQELTFFLWGVNHHHHRLHHHHLHDHIHGHHPHCLVRLAWVGGQVRPGVSGEELIDAQTSLSQLRFHEEKHPVHRHRHHRDGEDGDHNVFGLEDQ